MNFSDTEQQNIPEDVLSQLADRYTKYKYISSGATSSVFKAHDTILDKTVALKILKHSDQKVLIRFQQEAKSLSLLEHRNLVQILDFNVTKKHHAYLIMEYVEGEDLGSVVERMGPMPLDLALSIVLSICQGMNHAHSKKIIHRDLKTSNILVDNLDNPKVTIVDFGLAAKQAQDDTVVQTSTETSGLNTTEGKIQGSPLYMSPEQANGKDVDHRSDIYSLGCILFKLLTGQTPFNSDELMDLLRKHINETPPKLSDILDEEFPEEIESVVAKMLTKNPAKRFQSMHEVERAINELGKEQEELATEFSTTNKQSNFLLYAAFASIVLVAGFVVVGILMPNSDPSIPESEVKVERIDEIRKGFSLGVNTNFNEHDEHFWLGPSMSMRNSLEDRDLKYLATIIEEQREKRDLIKLKERKLRQDNRNNPRFKLKSQKTYSNSLNLLETKISGSGIKSLIDSEIQRLDLSKTRLDTVAYEYLAQMPKLDRLLLDYSDLTDTDLQKLWQSQALIDLDLKNCKNITDEGLKGIENCSKLISLVLSNKQTKSVYDPTKANKTNTEVTVNEKITDKALEYIAKSKSIRRINFDGTSITDKGMEALLNAPFRPSNQIDSLELDLCRGITGKSMKLIAEKNPRLKYLGISYTSITPEDLKYVVNLTKLRTINLSSIDVGKEELKILGHLTKLKFLYMSTMLGNDEEIQELGKLKNLNTLLILEAPNLTRKGFDELKSKLSKKVTIMCPKFVPKSLDRHSKFMTDIDSMQLD